MYDERDASAIERTAFVTGGKVMEKSGRRFASVACVDRLDAQDDWNHEAARHDIRLMINEGKRVLTFGAS